MDHIIDFVREFARTDWGQTVLVEIEEFGLPGVDSAAEVTELQTLFMQLAREYRAEEKKRNMPTP